jgi:hypothetical protein
MCYRVRAENLVLLVNLGKMAWVALLDPREEKDHQERMVCR